MSHMNDIQKSMYLDSLNKQSEIASERKKKKRNKKKRAANKQQAILDQRF